MLKKRKYFSLLFIFVSGIKAEIIDGESKVFPNRQKMWQVLEKE